MKRIPRLFNNWSKFCPIELGSGMYVGNGGGTDVGETGVDASGFFIVPTMIYSS
jgi:hypothetical protein